MSISQNFTDTEGFLWDFVSGLDNGAGFGPGLLAQDGSSDAFDGGFLLAVNGTSINPGTASVDANGRELNTIPVLSGDIAISRSILVSDASVSPVGFARFLDSFTNTGTTTQTITVTISTNTGSDAATQLQATSSGDLVLTAADFGFVSDEAGNLNGADPAVGHAYGDGVGLLPTAAGLSGVGSVNTIVSRTYSLTLNPGETQRLLQYGVQNNTAAASVTDYQLFTHNLDTLRASNFLAGMSETEISQVVNYSYAGGALRPVVLTDGDGNRWGLDPNKLGLRTLDTDVLLNANGGDVVAQNFTVVGPVTMAEDGQEANYHATFNGFPDVSALYSVMASPTQGYVRALLRIDPAIHPLDLDGIVGTGLDVKLGGTPSLIADRPLAGGAGDGSVSILDSGVVVDDSASGAGGTRPALTVVFGSTAALDADTDGEANTLSGNVLRAIDTGIFVAPGTTASFLYFFALNDDGLGGLADLNNLSHPGYEALAGLSASEVASIRNFTLTETDRLQTTTGNFGGDTLNGHFWGDSLNGLGGDDRLFGFGSDDVLKGGAGNDALDGGSGGDSMDGGDGNDVYFADVATDVTAEINAVLATGGDDLVRYSGAAGTMFTLGNNIERLTLAGSAGSNGTGNGLANTLTGNPSDNLLAGLAGNDTLEGAGGFDTLNGGADDDILRGGALFDTVDGGTGNDTIQVFEGEFGDDVNGGADTDTLDLGGLVTNTANVNLATGIWSTSLVSFPLTIVNVENVIGGHGSDTLTGNSFANTLNGGALGDTMRGGGGNDIYVVDSAADTVDELNNAGAGTADLVQSSISLSLAASARMLGAVENLTLLNVATALNATGNGAANLLTGNGFANILNGGALGDTMRGGANNDTYVVDSSLDTVDEQNNGGAGTADLVKSSVNFSLVASARVLGTVENLTLTGSAVSGLGNASANIITGNAFANALSGGIGIDTLSGGLGNDNLNGGASNDFFVFNTAPNTAGNRDAIADFTNAAGNNDTFRMENAIFTKLVAAGGLNPLLFHNGATAADANDYIVYNQATGALFYDFNGNLAGGAIQFASLTTRPLLTASDFVVI